MPQIFSAARNESWIRVGRREGKNDSLCKVPNEKGSEVFDWITHKRVTSRERVKRGKERESDTREDIEGIE